MERKRFTIRVLKLNYKPLNLIAMQSQRQNNTMRTSGSTVANGNQPSTQNKSDLKSIDTVTPDNDNGKPGQPVKQKSNVQPPQFSEDRSSNKGQGPAGENL